jgi:hypothetical protein
MFIANMWMMHARPGCLHSIVFEEAHIRPKQTPAIHLQDGKSVQSMKRQQRQVYCVGVSRVARNDSCWAQSSTRGILQQPSHPAICRQVGAGWKQHSLNHGCHHY